MVELARAALAALLAWLRCQKVQCELAERLAEQMIARVEQERGKGN